MLINWIIASILAQAVAYLALDRLKLPRWKFWVLLVALIAHWFVYPQLFLPEPPEGEFTCGLPVLGFMMGFWILGTAGTLFTHVAYQLCSLTIYNIKK